MRVPSDVKSSILLYKDRLRAKFNDEVELKYHFSVLINYVQIFDALMKNRINLKELKEEYEYCTKNDCLSSFRCCNPLYTDESDLWFFPIETLKTIKHAFDRPYSSFEDFLFKAMNIIADMYVSLRCIELPLEYNDYLYRGMRLNKGDELYPMVGYTSFSWNVNEAKSFFYKGGVEIDHNLYDYYLIKFRPCSKPGIWMDIIFSAQSEVLVFFQTPPSIVSITEENIRCKYLSVIIEDLDTPCLANQLT